MLTGRTSRTLRAIRPDPQDRAHRPRGRNGPGTPARRLGNGGVLAGATLIGAVVGLLFGPVALIAAGWYAGLGLWSRRAASAAESVRLRRTTAIETVGELAADLRAGVRLPESTTIDDPVAAARVAAARFVSDRLGAPLAELLELVETDLRSEYRSRERARAMLAGTRTTTLLLMCLPVLGTAVGTGIGTASTTVLLHTGPGAVCVVIAIGLQTAGYAIAARITATAAM